jgi:hypothetical protein
MPAIFSDNPAGFFFNGFNAGFSAADASGQSETARMTKRIDRKCVLRSGMGFLQIDATKASSRSGVRKLAGLKEQAEQTLLVIPF